MRIKNERVGKKRTVYPVAGLSHLQAVQAAGYWRLPHYTEGTTEDRRAVQREELEFFYV